MDKDEKVVVVVVEVVVVVVVVVAPPDPPNLQKVMIFLQFSNFLKAEPSKTLGFLTFGSQRTRSGASKKLKNQSLFLLFRRKCQKTEVFFNIFLKKYEKVTGFLTFLKHLSVFPGSQKLKNLRFLKVRPSKS